MSKRKDLRNGRESGARKPHKWSVPKCQAFTGHVLTVFLMELEREMPRQVATAVFGEFLRERDRIANQQFARRWAFPRGSA